MQKKQRRYPQKLFLTYSTALLAILLCLFAGNVFVSFREYRSTHIETRRQLVSKTLEQVDASLQGMDRIINGLLFSRSFIDIMKDEQALLHYTDYSKRVLNLFVAMDAPLFPTHRIIAFRDDIYYNLSKEGENQDRIQETLENYPWQAQVHTLDGKKMILPPHKDPFDPASPLVYSVARSVYDQGRAYGIVEVQNKYEQLAALCQLDAHIGSLALFAPDGERIYPLDAGADVPDFLYDAIDQTGNSEGSFTERNTLVVFHKSDYSGFIAAIYGHAGAGVQYALSLTVVSILSFLLLTALCLFTIRLITNRMTAPLVDLNEALTHVTLSNLSLSLPEAHLQIVEIDNINRSFQMMITGLKAAIEKNAQSQANEERAKYLALQSQMNPHTIYNTIGMIESVSYMNGDKEVSGLLICFSQMLRYISDYSKREYTVRDEIANLHNYAALIKKRYEGKLTIQTDVHPALMERILPKFTLQPLVENAAKHGFGGACDALLIDVLVQQTEDAWYISVTDNGQGFAPGAIDEITKEFAQCRKQLADNDDYLQKQIGKLALTNIYMRCLILYGDRFSAEVSNAEAGGASIRLTITKGDDHVPHCAD